MQPEAEPLRSLPLHGLHLEAGATFAPFAGHAMPMHYRPGVLTEHLHTRSHAGLFDVSHMGQVILRPRGTMADTLAAIEAMMPVDAHGLAVGRQRYGLLTNEAGGIEDDLMIARREDALHVVVNASRKADDMAHMTRYLGATTDVVAVGDRCLLAVQGPMAAAAVAVLLPGTGAMRFMDFAALSWQGAEVWVSRSGYTGEDGFEISVPGARAEVFATALLAQNGVAWIGLGARDSLRLEAGLCLYGQDIDAATSPVEAGLTFAIAPARRAGRARAGGFPGAARVLAEMASGPSRLRVGLRPDGRAPMRAGTLLFTPEGDAVGRVTSGGFGPSLDAPLAMGYGARHLSAPGTALMGEVRGKRLPVTVVPLPFLPPGFKR